MDILAFGNYDVNTYLKQSPGGKGEWGNIKLRTSGSECDILIVFNKPVRDIHVKCRKGGRWLVIQEPPYEKNSYFTYYFRYFDLVISSFNLKGNFSAINDFALLPWHIGKSYDELLAIGRQDLSNKQDRVVWVTSSSNMNPGHQPRLDFLDYIQKTDLPFEVYGRGIRPLDIKHDVLFPAKYSLAVENYSAENYWTEKIADAFLGWCMPVYYGCKNIEKYFPANSLIKIDIHDKEGSVKKIRQAIEEDWWGQNLDAIAEARELVMQKYNFFPYIEKNLVSRLSPKKTKVFIPADPAAIGSRIKNFFINRI